MAKNYCAVYDECKYSDTFWLADRARLFSQNTISLSSLCKLIWRHWTYKMPLRYILSSVWARLSMFSPLSITQYVGLYIFSLPISYVMIERIYILCLIIIIKSEVWTITYCLGLGHESMVSAVCLSILPWYCDVHCWRLGKAAGDIGYRLFRFRTVRSFTVEDIQTILFPQPTRSRTQLVASWWKALEKAL